MAEFCFRQGSSLILASGIGKSGIVASKLAASLTSIGIRSFFISLEDLNHGGLGAIRDDTAVVLISKSGEGSELIQILPLIKSKASCILAITSSPDSTLAQQADFTISIGAVQELDFAGVLPTTSTLLSLIAADLFLVEMARRLPISEFEFLSNHPGGSIGENLSAPITHKMISVSNCPVLGPSATLSEGIEVLERFHLGVVLVVSETGMLKGLLTDGDLRALVSARRFKIAGVMIGEVMNTYPVVASPELSVGEALTLMRLKSSRHLNFLPIVEADGHLVGLVTLGMLASRVLAEDKDD